MTVKAKFKCISSEPQEGDQTMVKFTAVVDGCEENKSFSRWTPYGTTDLLISNETPAASYFKPEKEYYLTFEEAE